MFVAVTLVIDLIQTNGHALMSMSVLKGLMTVTITVSIPLAAFDALAPLAMS
jgi:hypothetical protein